MEEINGLTIVNSYSQFGYFLIELSDGKYLEIEAGMEYSYGSDSPTWETKIITDLDDYQKLKLGKITREEYDKICNEKLERERQERLQKEKERELQQLAILQAKYNLSQ